MMSRNEYNGAYCIPPQRHGGPAVLPQLVDNIQEKVAVTALRHLSKSSSPLIGAYLREKPC